jgi:ribosomal-protein-alanine N-acetyltransferase
MQLQSQNLFLREFIPEDLPAILEYERKPETHWFEREVPEEEVVKKRLEEILEWAKEEPRTHYRFAIFLPPVTQVVGMLALTINNLEIREWEIGWVLRSDQWGRGFAGEAASKVLNFAFNKLQAHRVVAFCNAKNQASERVMEKIGMQFEGRLRQTRWWHDAWCDELVYGILDQDWADTHSGDV